MSKSELQSKNVQTLLADQLNLSDVILLNKMDSVSDTQKANLRERLNEVNPRAKYVECSYGNVDLDEVLHVNSFSFETALNVDD